jgi:hypothetical protein
LIYLVWFDFSRNARKQLITFVVALILKSRFMSKLALSVAMIMWSLTFGVYHTAFGQTFNGTTNSDWGTASNWSPASVPSGATTGVTLSASATITGSNVTIGNITTSSSAAITLSNGNGKSLTVGSSGNSANLTFSKGGQLDITSSATIWGDLIINIPTGSTFTLNVSNGATLDIKGNIVITGGGNFVINNTATLKVGGNISGGTGNATINQSNGGGFTVGGSISLATLTLTATSSMTIGGGITATANSSISNSNGANLTAGGPITLGNNSTITNTGNTISATGYSLGSGYCITDNNGGKIKNTTTGQTCTSSTCASPCSVGVTLLPITLTGLFSSLETTSINLKWSTASEINFDYFSLQKSADGKLFNEIAQVKGHGTTNERNDYSYEDIYPLIGKNYYRLTSVDFDNYRETFEVLVQDYSGGKDFHISPNPSDGQTITLNFNFDNKDGQVIIYDNMGSIVGSFQANESGRVSFTNTLKDGIYFAKYSAPSFTKAIRFLVKQ